MTAKLSESLKIDFEAMPSSTAAGTTSAPYDMAGYSDAFVGVAIGLRPASISTLTSAAANIVVDLMETSAVTAAMTSAAGGKTGITLGATGNTAITATAGCRSIFLKMGTDCTAGQTFHFGLGTVDVLFTQSTFGTMITPSSNYTATAAYFGQGSGLDSTANTAETIALDSIRTALSSTRLAIGGPNVFAFSTPSTNSMSIKVVNSDKGNITFSNTASTECILGYCGEVAGGFDIRSDQLTSTLAKRFIGVKMTTSAQIAGIGITVIRSKGRYMPANFAGKLSS